VKKLLLTTAFVIGSIGGAYADVIHNGSVMEVVTFPDHIAINYVAPRPILSGVGVHPGTTILTGRFNGDAFHGRAWVFSICGAFDYLVDGGLAPNGDLVVEGLEPDIRTDCGVYGAKWGRNSHLVFTEVGRHLAPPPAVVVAPPVVVPPVVVAPNIDNSKTHIGPTTTQEQTNKNTQKVETNIQIIMPKDGKAAPEVKVLKEPEGEVK
jgi:hypothetical protein